MNPLIQKPFALISIVRAASLRSLIWISLTSSTDVFFVVRQYTDKNSTVYYQVNVVYKEGVDIPTPSIPATAVWKRNENFRRLLLSKCMLILIMPNKCING